MKIVGARRPGSKVIGRVQGISRLAKARSKWVDHYAAHGNAALTCRYFGISRQTFYRWKRRYNPRDLRSLEERSHRPRRLRQPTWSRGLALAVLHLREQYPRWGWGIGVLGSEETGIIEVWLPLFLFAILFGLSMDYHMLLLNRIKEAYDQGHGNEGSISLNPNPPKDTDGRGEGSGGGG